MSLTKEQLAASYEAHQHYGVDWTTLAEVAGYSYSAFMRIKKRFESTVVIDNCIKPDIKKLKKNPANNFLMSNLR